MKAHVFAAALFVSTSLSLFAQTQPCTRAGITVAGCLEELAPSTLLAHTDAAETAVAEEQEDVADEATGSPAIESAAGNSLRDFLSLFSAAVQNANLSEEGDALTLDYNLRLSDLGKRVIKIQGVLRRPELWEPFATSLATDADRERLQKGLDDLDDVTLTLTYSPEGDTVGRMLEPHRPLFDAIMSARVTPRDPGAAHDDLLRTVRELRRQNPSLLPAGATELDDIVFDRITDPVARELLRLKTIEHGRQLADTRADFDRQFEAAGLNLFSDLLDNQPQFYVAVSTRERDSVAGPRERTLRATYEMGFVNLNDFKEDAGVACDDMENDAASCAAAYANYIADRKNLAGLGASNRVALSLEYTDVEDYDITAEGVTDPFHVDGSRKWSGSFLYGRRMIQGEDSARDARFDLSLTYEDIDSKDEKVDNRWIASAIYTQKLSDTLSFPLGLVWSSHEANVPDSDQKLSAHFGLVFKVPQMQ